MHQYKPVVSCFLFIHGKAFHECPDFYISWSEFYHHDGLAIHRYLHPYIPLSYISCVLPELMEFTLNIQIMWHNYEFISLL